MTSDPWAYFALPSEEKQRLKELFTKMVSHEMLLGLIDHTLLGKNHDTMKSPTPIYGVGNAQQIAWCTVFIIGDFIAQYHALGDKYRLPLMPKFVMWWFSPPYRYLHDLNWDAQEIVYKKLGIPLKRGIQSG